MLKLLLVEDEYNISSFMKRGLTIGGYSVDVANDGREAWHILQSQSYDLIIADIIMPHLSGLQLCRLFRDKFGYTVPIILLTALASTHDIVNGLDAGADDYLVKPFKFAELEARLKALIRRVRKPVEEKYYLNTELCFADLILNTNTKQAMRNGLIINLTAKEYALLEFFIANPNTVLSRQTILEKVWDLNFDTNTNLVDVYVNYIRNKIQKADTAKLIHTVVGMGYIMREQ
ncbi:two-component regulatory system response regulator CusR [Bacteroidales bacterium]|nr:two-component regulatory system response regulator CusR [Bacteroidales bacterium]